MCAQMKQKTGVHAQHTHEVMSYTQPHTDAATSQNTQYAATSQECARK